MSCSDTYYLNENTTVNAGDLMRIFNTSNGAERKISINTLATYLQTVVNTGIPQFDTQYNSPTATGFSVSITNTSANTHLILTPLAGYATGTIVLPISTVAIDKQRILVNSTQAVTTLTITGNGASVLGQPTLLSANGYFELKYDATLNTWYRVG
jgi:hypothetical protein